MITNFKITKVIYTIIIVLITSAAFADVTDPPSFGDDVVDNTMDNPTAAPIDDYVVEAIVLGAFIAFYGIRKNRQVKLF